MSETLPPEARLRRRLSGWLRPLETGLRRGWLRLMDSAVLLRPARPDPGRVLLVRLDNIGDFVVWAHAAKAIAAHFQDRGKQVTLLGSAGWASFAADLGIFDEVRALDQRAFRHDLGYRRRLLRAVREAGFGTVIQPTANRVPEMGDAVVRVSGAPERVGAAAQLAMQAKPKGGADALYTRLIPVDPETAGEMQANAAFVRALTGRDYRAQIADLKTDNDRERLGELAQRLPAAPYVVLFPGASAAGRQWPYEHFAALARRCVEELACAVVVCGGPGDVQLAEATVRAAGKGVKHLAGETTLQQLTAVIAGAQLLVSNETSAVHLAAAVGTPCVCITGGGHFGRFVPYPDEAAGGRALPVVAARPMECFGCNWKCRFHPRKGKPMPCVEQIPVDAVWELAAPLFGRQFEEAGA